MKTRITTLLITLGTVLSLSAEETGKHLFILSGQSNMAGLDPKISFIPAVEAEFGKDRVIVVKDAHNGQPISRWYKQWKPAEGGAPEVTGDLYTVLMEKVNTAIKGEKIASVTFIWMQGERDAASKLSGVYEKSLKGLIGQLVTDLGRQDIHYVIGRLSDCHGEKNQSWTQLREAQVNFAKSSPLGAWVDTDDLNDKKDREGKMRNDLHYSRDGYKILGQRFAEKSIALLKQ